MSGPTKIPPKKPERAIDGWASKAAPPPPDDPGPGGKHKNGTPPPGEPSSAGWPAPSPQPGGLRPVPPLTTSMLPPPFRPWLSDIAERTQAPLDFAAVGAIVACGAVIGRTIGIRPKRQDEWTVVPNLWGAAVGRPGLMKSPMLNEATRPLNRLVADAFKAFEIAEQNMHFEEAVLKAKQAKFDADLKKAVAAGEDLAALRAEMAKDAPRAPVAKRYMVNDSTVEKLGELLNQNPRGLLTFRDEIIGFLRSMDREGHENDRAFYLESWAGDGKYIYDRIGRGTVRIDAACVSILGGIQPQTLSDYLIAAAKAGRGDDGLIQRFQLLVYPDVAKEWVNVDRWPDNESKNRAYRVFKALDDLDPVKVGATAVEDGIPFLRFTDSAQKMFDAWRGILERRVRADEDHPAVVAHLAKFRSLMPSLALIFHLIDVVDGRHAEPVTAFAAQQAIEWCDYLEQHARRVYQSVTERSANAARLLGGKIKGGKLPDPFTVRQVCEHDWSGLTERDDVVAALGTLEDLGWVRSSTVKSPTGGRPKEVFHRNPAFGTACAA